MKKGLAILTAICLCLSSVSVCASAVSAMAEGRQKTTIFVQFEGDPVLMGEAKGLSEKSAIAQMAKAQKHAMQSVENAAGSAEVLYTYTHALSGVAMEATKRDAAVLRDTEGVVNVVDLGGVRPIRAAAERGEPIASGDMIGVDEMRELGYDGTGTAIAVIDCGLEYNHETMRLTDESTAKYTKADVDKVIRGTTLHAEGVTIIMISHDVEAAVKYATHILHIGDITFFGSKKDYLNSQPGRRFLSGKKERGEK